MGRASATNNAALGLAALGVVYGDIGTSPLYAFKVAVQAAGGGAQAAIGVASLILWSLLLVVSLKYAVLIMRADNRGEGGVVAMLALLGVHDAKPGTRQAALLILGLLGAALLYGDGAITPAISVLSAVEGLELDAPHLAPLVLPITVVILITLFVVQAKGTGFIGRIFGPIMLVWFGAIALLGLMGIMRDPAVLAALSPGQAIGFLIHAPLGVGFAVLGAVFLAVTGGEAMYADMGHFGRFPIRLAWFAVALPALVLNYLGQAALIATHPAALANPFYGLAPAWAHYPLVVFATAATVIASQAIISGVFSLTQQSIQLGFLPRLFIRHTAADQEGQVYLPLANWTLAIATLTAALVFRSSDALAGAYGIAVSGLMAISTFLAALIARRWGYNLGLITLVNGAFSILDLVFFSANAIKLTEGGWFPLLIAGVLAFLMLTWRTGVALVENARAHLRADEAVFLSELATAAPCRTDGIGAFLSASRTGIPLSLTHYIRHSRSLQQRVILVSVGTVEKPHVLDEERAEFVELSKDVQRVILHFGFMEHFDIPAGLATTGLFDDGELKQISYYIGRETVIADARIKGMAHWRERLFVSMQRNTAPNGSSFCIPSMQLVEIGTEVRI
ncbi:KUP/HAK/KT family potassium transporter [Sphingomonas sanguinis]|uniref:potassium transporter Kup n=1 Tax=Sphingomonas sanguinis TaxID=33051 RepID=UPI001C59AEA4|nr:KUP/HAK/KT family potassium transporter [Sphingomonas sanguinis]QXT35409.1 KUP/HAK/KT family potassium transporter [Sphingomonas sanguinis]